MNLFRETNLQNGQPHLCPRETIKIFRAGIGLYDGNQKLANFEDGTIYITTLRIIWINSNNINAIEIKLDRIKSVTSQNGFLRSSPKIILALGPLVDQMESDAKWNCQVCHFLNFKDDIKCSNCGVKQASLVDQTKCNKCTFLNKLGSLQCEMCESLLPSSGIEQGDLQENIILKLSFRAGGMTETLEQLNDMLLKKQWVKQEVVPVARIVGGGISGITKNIENTFKRNTETLENSFQDLEKLMEKASEMTNLAKQIISKLGNENSPETIQFRNQMTDFGIIDPVTKQTSSDYHKELSEELSNFLLKLNQRQKSDIYSLSDMYCLFNRARGIALVSPQDLYRAGVQLESIGSSFKLTTFDSGVVVLKSIDRQDEAVSSKIMSYLESEHRVNATRLSKLEKCSVLIAKEDLLMTERNGLTCRDETNFGLFFYANLFNHEIHK